LANFDSIFYLQELTFDPLRHLPKSHNNDA
jgi:hypothetical protein